MTRSRHEDKPRMVTDPIGRGLLAATGDQILAGVIIGLFNRIDSVWSRVAARRARKARGKQIDSTQKELIKLSKCIPGDIGRPIDGQ